MANRPLAWFTLDALSRAGVDDVVINLHYLADAGESALRAALPRGMAAAFLREPELLGTGGSLRAARDRHGLGAKDPVVVMNADIVFDAPIASALDVHRASGSIATMVLRPDPKAALLGAVEYDGAGRVRRLLGNPEARGAESLSEAMFTGVHVLSPAAFDAMPSNGCVIRSAYRAWIDGDAPVHAHVTDQAFFDVGTLDGYLAVHAALWSGDVAWPGIVPTRDAIAPSARIGVGARLDRTWIGAGASIAAGVHLRGCVVWPGAAVTESAEDAVFAAEGVRLGRTR